MAAIKLTAFSGEQPRIIPRLMAETAAQAATNVRLDDGALTPLRKSALIAQTPSSSVQTLYKWGSTWLSWNAVVHAAVGPVADDRLYYTGDGKPRMRVGSTIYDLAVPRPGASLTAALGGSGSGDVQSRLYVFTWVTDFGEESEPSPISNEVLWQPGNTVTLSGFPSTPSGRNITKQRIYRSQTGYSGTQLYFIAERAASTGNFVDNIAVDAFQEPLPSMDWNAPPDNLAGLTTLPNGMMAAFVGKKLYFSEPWRPHAWPEKYVLTTDSAIVGLGAMGTSLVVLTKAQPYLVSGSAPDTMQMDKLEQNLPCINARGIVDLGYSIAYPSNDGLVVISPNGTASMPTAAIFDRDDWQALSPKTIIGAQFTGRYIAFYSTFGPDGSRRIGAVLLDLSGSSSYLIRTDLQASAAFFDVESSSLYFLEKNKKDIRLFDAPSAARETLYWKSKQFVLGRPENFGCILVDADTSLDGQDEQSLNDAIAAAIQANEALIADGSILGDLNSAEINLVTVAGDILEPIPRKTAEFVVGIYADGKRVASVTQPNSVVRLPAGFKARSWEIDVSTNVQVQAISMATTIDELKAMQ